MTADPTGRARIVHLGLGAFFRAHGAIYIQEANQQSSQKWDVIGVSLRSARVRDTLAGLNNTYHATELSPAGMRAQAIDVITDVLVGPEDGETILDNMVSAETKIVSLTITEKGYCRGSDGGLDLKHPDIAHDLAHDMPRSAPGFVLRALAQRRAAGLRPFTVMSLDNLPANGAVTKNIIITMAAQIDPNLADWIDKECCFPSTMVDRIVPATTNDLLMRLEHETGITDQGAVFHEPFRQWVIEDCFVDHMRPNFGAVGAELVKDVAPYEHMKLRMLNGTHSTLAYLGSLLGHVSVFDAINDPRIEALLDQIWSTEIAPSFRAPGGTDLDQYAADLKARYQNPEIKHLLMQIAMDGTQKLPQRILEPLFENVHHQRAIDGLVLALAAWMRFVQTQAATGRINDPLGEMLCAIGTRAKTDKELVDALFAIEEVFCKYPTSSIIYNVLEKLEYLDFILSDTMDDRGDT